MEKPITATYRWTKEEFVRLQKAHTRHSKRLRSLYWFCRGMGLVIILIGIMGWRQRTQNLAGTIFTLLFGSFFLLLPQYTRMRVGKIYDRMPERDREVTYEISDEGVSVKSEIASTELSWRALHKVIRTRDGFLFYPTEVSAYWLPLSAFREAADAEKVAEIARANVRQYREVKS